MPSLQEIGRVFGRRNSEKPRAELKLHALREDIWAGGEGLGNPISNFAVINCETPQEVHAVGKFFGEKQRQISESIGEPLLVYYFNLARVSGRPRIIEHFQLGKIQEAGLHLELRPHYNEAPLIVRTGGYAYKALILGRPPMSPPDFKDDDIPFFRRPTEVAVGEKGIRDWCQDLRKRFVFENLSRVLENNLARTISSPA